MARFSGGASPLNLADGGSGEEEDEASRRATTEEKEEEEEEEDDDEDEGVREATREAALCTPLLARAKFLLNEVRVAREAARADESAAATPTVTPEASAVTSPKEDATTARETAGATTCGGSGAGGGGFSAVATSGGGAGAGASAELDLASTLPPPVSRAAWPLGAPRFDMPKPYPNSNPNPNPNSNHNPNPYPNPNPRRASLRDASCVAQRLCRRPARGTAAYRADGRRRRLAAAAPNPNPNPKLNPAHNPNPNLSPNPNPNPNPDPNRKP